MLSIPNPFLKRSLFSTIRSLVEMYPLCLLTSPDIRGDITHAIHCFQCKFFFFCCVFYVYFCTSEVLRTAGFEEGLIPYVSLGVGLCVFLPTLLCVRHTVSVCYSGFSCAYSEVSAFLPFQTFTIEQFGRKTVLCKGCAFMALALSVLTVTLSLQVRRNFKLFYSHCCFTPRDRCVSCHSNKTKWL